MKITPALHPEPAVADAIADALAELRAAEARAGEALKALAAVNAAVGRAQGHVAEHTAAQARLAQLREARRGLMAAFFLGNGDEQAVAASAAEIAALESRVRELEPLARDAEGALAALEGKHAAAAAPVTAAGVEVGACRHRLLMACGEALLDAYGAQIEAALDRYAELVCLASEINQYARLANMPLVAPEIPQRFEFPGISIGRWKPLNVAGVPPDEMRAAPARLAKRLDALGVTL